MTPSTHVTIMILRVSIHGQFRRQFVLRCHKHPLPSAAKRHLAPDRRKMYSQTTWLMRELFSKSPCIFWRRVYIPSSCQRLEGQKLKLVEPVTLFCTNKMFIFLLHILVTLYDACYQSTTNWEHCGEVMFRESLWNQKQSISLDIQLCGHYVFLQAERSAMVCPSKDSIIIA